MQLLGLIAKYLSEPDAVKLPKPTKQPAEATKPGPAKYCAKCGTALKPTAKFCPSCGNKIS